MTQISTREQVLRALLDAVLDGAPNERGSLLALAREKMS